MVNLKPAVFAALETVCENVFFYYPESFKKLPCVSYYEASNTIGAAGDDDEYASDVEFAVDVWANAATGTSDLANAVNTAMKRAGFSRAFAADVYDPESKVRHYAMRFRTLRKG